VRKWKVELRGGGQGVRQETPTPALLPANKLARKKRRGEEAAD
jgi:hypothetical protein